MKLRIFLNPFPISCLTAKRAWPVILSNLVWLWDFLEKIIRKKAEAVKVFPDFQTAKQEQMPLFRILWTEKDEDKCIFNPLIEEDEKEKGEPPWSPPQSLLHKAHIDKACPLQPKVKKFLGLDKNLLQRGLKEHVNSPPGIRICCAYCCCSPRQLQGQEPLQCRSPFGHLRHGSPPP